MRGEREREMKKIGGRKRDTTDEKERKKEPKKEEKMNPSPVVRRSK